MTPTDNPDKSQAAARALRRSNRSIDMAQENMLKTVAQVQQELDELDAKVLRLRGAWTGEASDAYDFAQQNWNRQLTYMRELLEDYSKRLGRINDRYRAASTKVQGSIWS